MKNSLLFCLLLLFNPCIVKAETKNYDIVIYGATSAGVIAAVQAHRMGKSVVLIHPGKHIGGATSNGLSFVDSNRHVLIGGITKEFFSHVWQYYQNDSAWIYEAKHPMKDQQGNPKPNEKTMWILEPHVAERIFKAMVKAEQVLVVLNERLDRANGVQKEGQQITQIQMESGNIYQGKIFIDTTYEGDLMAASDVSYIVGRESNAQYGELYNGIQLNKRAKQFPVHIDPYKIKGDPTSGLLPRIYLMTGNEGEADPGTQAYTFRMCLTAVPENKEIIQQPLDYDETQYEILLRAVESGAHKFFKFNLLPNLKTDCNNLGLISTDYVGMSWNWSMADYTTRQQIANEHYKWQIGLLWTLQNHPRVTPAVKKKYSGWGLPKDEFVENNHWPYELYVREARRLISDTVITENMVFGIEPVTDGVGLASYHIDSHNVKYYVNSDQEVGEEGGLFITIPAPFPISYQALVPKKSECQNLIVPVCLSATHVAYAPIRMEPTYMVLGQSAATAAAFAIDLGMSVQDIPYEMLKSKLLNDRQVLEDSKK